MGFTVYILYSKLKNRYYIGQTNSLERGIAEHNTGLCNSTKAGVPRLLVYTKEFATRSEAMKYERNLKNKRKIKIFSPLIFN